MLNSDKSGINIAIFAENQNNFGHFRGEKLSFLFENDYSEFEPRFLSSQILIFLDFQRF